MEVSLNTLNPDPAAPLTIASWGDVKEMEPLLQKQHKFAKSSAGSHSRGYYVKRYCSYFLSILFLMIVIATTFVLAWHKVNGTSTTASPPTTGSRSHEDSNNQIITQPAAVTTVGTVNPASAPTAAVEVRIVALPPSVLAAQPPASATIKSSKPTLIPWELQKSHPTYVPSRIPTFTFEFIDGGLAYGAAQADGYHPEANQEGSAPPPLLGPPAVGVGPPPAGPAGPSEGGGGPPP